MKFLRNAVEQKFGCSEAEPYSRCYRLYRAFFGVCLHFLTPPLFRRSTGRAEAVFIPVFPKCSYIFPLLGSGKSLFENYYHPYIG